MFSLGSNESALLVKMSCPKIFFFVMVSGSSIARESGIIISKMLPILDIVWSSGSRALRSLLSRVPSSFCPAVPLCLEFLFFLLSEDVSSEEYCSFRRSTCSLVTPFASNSLPICCSDLPTALCLFM